MTASTPADTLGSLAAREVRGGRRSTAVMLVGPATIFVTVGLLIPIVILLRYSLNQFVPGQMMVEAWTLENYVLFFTDPYYTAAFYRTLRVVNPSAVMCYLRTPRVTLVGSSPEIMVRVVDGRVTVRPQS